MPVYVYRNLVTNETFEYQQRITEDALSVDPRTGDPVRRVIQPVGIAFKGSGFYVNDSRKSSSSSSGSDKSSVSSDAPSGGETASSGSEKSSAASTAAPTSAGEKSGSKSGGQSGTTSSAAGGKPAGA